MDVRLKYKLISQPVVNRYFLSCLGLYCMLYFFKFYARNQLPKLVTNYAADVLCLPVVLSLTVSILRGLRKAPSLLLSPIQVFISFVYLSVVFEGLLPSFSEQYVGDIYDVIAYGLGAIIYYLIQHILRKRNFLPIKGVK